MRTNILVVGALEWGMCVVAFGGEPGLVASYSFEGDARDRSGNGHDGTIIGATFTEDRFGNEGGALAFDGVDDLVEIADEAAFDLDQFTLAAIVKVTGLPNLQNTIVTKSRALGFGGGNFSLWLTGCYPPGEAGYAGYSQDIADGYLAASVAREPVPQQEFFCLAVTVSPAEFVGYLNGRQEIRTSFGVAPVRNDTPVTIGADRVGGNLFQGVVDELRVYDRVLSPAEVAGLCADLPIPAVHISEVRLVSLQEFEINGPLVPYEIELLNASAEPVEGVVVQTWMEQCETRHAAGGALTRCGDALGRVPPGRCLEQVWSRASDLGGGGEFQPGHAVLVIELQQRQENEQVHLTERRVTVTLIPRRPPCPGYDLMESELAHNIEIFGLGRICMADLQGLVGVERSCEYVDQATDLPTVDTSIVKLDLRGRDQDCGPISIALQPDRASTGKVVAQQSASLFPADSHFDVYIQVDIPNLSLSLKNCEPATMRCVVNQLPPFGCTYEIGLDGANFDVMLYAADADCANPGNALGQIVAADHTPTRPPPDGFLNCDLALTIPFKRGDCNGDGQVCGNVTDAVFLLGWLFLGTDEPRCLAACDANGDGIVIGNVTDGVYLLQFCFLGTAPPLSPFPQCGSDLTCLTCKEYLSCGG